MDPASLIREAARLAVAAAVLAVVLAAFLWRRRDFVIRVRGGRVECWGKVPKVLKPDLDEFLLRDLHLEGTVKIMGRRHKGRLRVWFRGRLSPGQQQRLRNFLLARL
jgi:uncharacterized protein DUF3634